MLSPASAPFFCSSVRPGMSLENKFGGSQNSRGPEACTNRVYNSLLTQRGGGERQKQASPPRHICHISRKRVNVIPVMRLKEKYAALIIKPSVQVRGIRNNSLWLLLGLING